MALSYELSPTIVLCVAIHLSLPRLTKYPFRGFPYTAIVLLLLIDCLLLLSLFSGDLVFGPCFLNKQYLVSFLVCDHLAGSAK